LLPYDVGVGVSSEVAEVEAAVSRLAYLLTRTRRHEDMKATSRVPLDRAAMVVLRQLAESGSVRPGELAAALHVEAPHVTRQVQLLERSGYVTRSPDPDDKRAQLLRLTAAGRSAANRMQSVSRRAIQDALAGWTAEDLHELATSLRRMVDDFSSHAAEQDTNAADGVAA
jgi:DNA-binding MarR family transcriptional regulator